MGFKGKIFLAICNQFHLHSLNGDYILVIELFSLMHVWPHKTYYLTDWIQWKLFGYLR